MNVDSCGDRLGRARRNKRFKRAQTACRRCRAKKTKCDNHRPACGFCVENYARCIYEDGVDGQDAHPEPTLRDLLDRMNHIANFLELDRQLPAQASAAPGTRLDRRHLDVLPGHASSLSPPATDSRYTVAASLSPGHDSQAASPAEISFEYTLKWPIFRDLAPDRVSSPVAQTTFTTDEGVSQDRGDKHILGYNRSTTRGAPGKQATPLVLSSDSHIPILCQRYLKVVHVKNPIFEVAKFNMHVQRVVEHGLDWDEDSCVVMLACALASCVKRIQESSDCFDSSLGPCDHSACEPTEMRSLLGGAYYLAARKRLGLLDVTLTSVQCFFLAGLYEMCCMNPASAWVHYSQACSRFQVILSQEKLGEHSQSPNFHVLERLYFSCSRTEQEIREELHLPPSGIAHVEFPSAFPSLPSWTSGNGASHNTAHTSPNSECLPPNVVQQDQEQSWYYYLASIALRKEATSIMNLLYRPGERSWVDNVEHMIHKAALQESELNQWRTLLPAMLKFDTDEGASEDLAFILECRQLQWRQISYRPLLYYIYDRGESPRVSYPIPNGDHDNRTTKPRCRVTLWNRRIS